MNFTDVQMKFMRKRAVLLQNYQATFRTPHGRAVLLDLLDKNHVLRSTVMERKSRPALDPIEMAFAEGRRNAVLEILAMLNMNTDKVEQLIRETNDVSRMAED